jgi:hypothetical protein
MRQFTHPQEEEEEKEEVCFSDNCIHILHTFKQWVKYINANE